jgi:trans-aconitate methyltransferase
MCLGISKAATPQEAMHRTHGGSEANTFGHRYLPRDHKSMSAKTSWDAELYEAKHNFVWKLGSGVIDLLEPRPGERILDLGCGTGQLTQAIAEKGAELVGLDSSPEMIGQARQNFPSIRFVLGNGTEMKFEREFDGVFSNAALHWMPRAELVIKGIAAALKNGGRFAAEFGGKGNIAHIMAAIHSVLAAYYDGDMPAARTYFPSISDYSTLLERNRLEVRFAHLFDRPTRLEGKRGMENWIRQFKWYYFSPLPPEKREEALARVVEELRPSLWRDGEWQADYRRLRILAVRC